MISEINKSSPDCEILNSRIVNAPRPLVYKAWTDPNHLKTGGDLKDLQTRLMLLT